MVLDDDGRGRSFYESDQSSQSCPDQTWDRDWPKAHQTAKLDSPIKDTRQTDLLLLPRQTSLEDDGPKALQI